VGRLDGKNVLISAAGQGIGREVAILFAAEGGQVWATDLDASKLTGLDDCHCLGLDVRDAGSISSALTRMGPLDVLFNCAGYVASGTILECTEEDWAYSFDVNVAGAYRLIRAALPSMLGLGGGSIINVASVASSVKGVPNRFAYGASKAALIGLTKSIAADFVQRGIRCNAICPGTVDTPSLHERLKNTGDYAKALETFIARQPMGRLGSASEIAALALYLASDESSFTTGQPFVIDGGWSN
jgi:2-keto-3-deoxy-L-fuconate dehydrogenase